MNMRALFRLKPAYLEVTFEHFKTLQTELFLLRQCVVKVVTMNYCVYCLYVVFTLGMGPDTQTVFTLGLLTSQTPKMAGWKVWECQGRHTGPGSRLTPSQSRPHVLQDPVPEHRDSEML